jgi:hypothetical protein
MLVNQRVLLLVEHPSLLYVQLAIRYFGMFLDTSINCVLLALELSHEAIRTAIRFLVSLDPGVGGAIKGGQWATRLVGTLLQFGL